MFIEFCSPQKLIGFCL